MNHPTEEGHYWVLAEGKGATPFVAYVWQLDHWGIYAPGTWMMQGTHWDHADAIAARVCEFHWSGPLTPPEFSDVIN